MGPARQLGIRLCPAVRELAMGTLHAELHFGVTKFLFGYCCLAVFFGKAGAQQAKLTRW